MTTDSVWLIERVFVDDKSIPLAMCPVVDRRIAEEEVAKLTRMYGGTYRAMEYRRVKEGE